MNKIFLSQIKKLKQDATRCKKSGKKSAKQVSKFNIDTENIFFDYSRNLIDSKTLTNLIKLAESLDIQDKFKKCAQAI
jgi:hypothetical protein